jgi:hypothetical protein
MEKRKAVGFTTEDTEGTEEDGRKRISGLWWLRKKRG